MRPLCCFILFIFLSNVRILSQDTVAKVLRIDSLPEEGLLLDKIFQPFFTTKPTGQGTGLGLSLSYDIIKAHGGEIKVDTTEGEFAEFVIQLPITVLM